MHRLAYGLRTMPSNAYSRSGGGGYSMYSRQPAPPMTPSPPKKAGYTRSYSVDRAGSNYGVVSPYGGSTASGTSYVSTLKQRRPLPSGPGPLDTRGRKIDTSSYRPHRRSTSISSGPLKADHTHRYTDNKYGTDSYGLTSRTEKDALTKKFDSLQLDEGYGSLSLSSGRRSRQDSYESSAPRRTPTERRTYDGTLPSPSSRDYASTRNYEYTSDHTRRHNAKNASNLISADYSPGVNSTSPVRNAQEYHSSESDSGNVSPATNKYGSVRKNSVSSNISVPSQSRKSSAENAGLVGLKNLGNTCFMNSVLQCLSNTKPLLEYCLNEDYHIDINKKSSSMKGQLMLAYANLMTSMWKDNTTSAVSPNAFKSQIQKFAPRFVGYSQQDSQEFLRYLLMGLHDDVNRIQRKPKPIDCREGDDEKMSSTEKSKECWKRYLHFDDSKIVDIFVGQLRSTLTCTTCNYSSVTFDPFWDLSVPIPKGKYDVPLKNCISLFMKEEILDGEERPTCAKCKTHRKCTKTFSIQKFPKILVLHLKRFSGERYRSKLSTHVDFPKTVDLSDFSNDKGGLSLYNLYGVSNHSGSVYSGHYMACCKNPYTSEWHNFNDSRVSSASSKSVVSPEGYVLFYEQSNTDSKL